MKRLVLFFCLFALSAGLVYAGGIGGRRVGREVAERTLEISTRKLSRYALREGGERTAMAGARLASNGTYWGRLVSRSAGQAAPTAVTRTTTRVSRGTSSVVTSRAVGTSARAQRNALGVIAQSGRHLDSLPFNEREAITALTDLTRHGPINGSLRGIPGSPPLSGENLRIATDAANALRRNPLPNDVTVFRKMTLPDDLMRRMGPNVYGPDGRLSHAGLKRLNRVRWTEQGFLHSSLDKNVAKRFDGNVVLQIKAPRGTPASYVGNVSHFPGEREIMMAPGQMLKLGRVFFEDGIPIIKARIVNPRTIL